MNVGIPADEDGSRQLQAPDCRAPTRLSDFVAGLIRPSFFPLLERLD
jgi:hypothetical protein